MMRIDIITVLPEMLEGFINESILSRARKKGLAEIELHNLRDYTLDKWRRVDDYPYGGSAGMVMQCEPIDRCISHLREQREYDDVIYVSPDGERFNQKIANDLSLKGNLIILCGHYKGIDQRVRDHLVTREISVGGLLPRRPAGRPHLYPTRRLQRLEGARDTPLRQRGQDTPVGAGASHGAHQAVAP